MDDIKDGVILRLNDLIDKYAPNYKKVLADHPDWRKQVMNDEGDLYGFPFIRGDPFLVVFPAIFIALALVSFTFLGDGLRDALDPKLKGKQ